MIGTSLGPYKIIEQLGAGGMGEVYLGEDTRLGRKVAIIKYGGRTKAIRTLVDVRLPIVGGVMRALRCISLLVVSLHIGGSALLAQDEGSQPVIDMHFHGALVFDEESVQPIQPWLDAFDSYNVKYAVLTAYPHHLAAWIGDR